MWTKIHFERNILHATFASRKASTSTELVIDVVNMGGGLFNQVALLFILITAIGDEHHSLALLLDGRLSNLSARYLIELILKLFMSESSLNNCSWIIALIVII